MGVSEETEIKCLFIERQTLNNSDTGNEPLL